MQWGRTNWIGPAPHPRIIEHLRRSRLRTALYALVVAGPLLAWVLASALGGPPHALARPVEEVTTNGSGALTVVWVPEGCEVAAPASSDVVADLEDVVVTVRALPADDVTTCGEQVGARSWTVLLDDPLGDRVVRDGSCLAPERRRIDEVCEDGAPTVPVVR